MVEVSLAGLPGPGSMLGGLDLAAIIKAKPDPCGFNQAPYVIVAIATVQNTPLFLPVAGATVEGRTDYISTKTIGQTDKNGILIACPPVVGIGVQEYRIIKDGVDFGNGQGQFSNYITLYGIGVSLFGNYNIFQGSITCPSGQVFDLVKMACATAPPICTPPQVLNPITGICETPPPVTCTPPAVFNPATGKCETPPPPPTICTPPQVFNPVTGKCEAPLIPKCPDGQIYDFRTNSCIPVNIPPPPAICTPPAVFNPITGICETPAKLPTCPQPQVFTPTTPKTVTYSTKGGRERTAVWCGGNVDVPCGQLDNSSLPVADRWVNSPPTPPECAPQPTCPALITQATIFSLPTLPAIITPGISALLNIGNIKQVCQSDPTNPAFIKTLNGAGLGKITIGGQTMSFDIINGAASIDLIKLFPSIFTPGVR